MCAKSPTFKYWELILHLEMLVLIFGRSHWERNFDLYIEIVGNFVLDHNNARWVPPYIRDMKKIPQSIQNNIKHFWVFPKTSKRFSAMPLDQAHDQNNAMLKDSGEAIGLTENPAALKRWMVSGPEQTRLIAKFETQLGSEDC